MISVQDSEWGRRTAAEKQVVKPKTNAPTSAWHRFTKKKIFEDECNTTVMT